MHRPLIKVTASFHLPPLGWTCLYFLTIVLANISLVWFTPIHLYGTLLPPAIFASGFVFVLRDFAQREIGHLVLGAIAAAALATYFLAGPGVALASTSAFLVAELADWVLYSLTKRPMSQRVLWSSLISVPLDTTIFFYLLGILDLMSLVLGIAIKLIATLVFWCCLSVRETLVERAQC